MPVRQKSTEDRSSHQLEIGLSYNFHIIKAGQRKMKLSSQDAWKGIAIISVVSIHSFGLLSFFPI